ncbi:ABC transporter substrate-binding protein [Paenibacillus sp. IB182496]|uniref:ABC transporter substrate-binding protein n=1 Tax=Paenibacillus sabuli TaxID=2772509 RepID=A0A927BRA2_9BACL|nr:ABC transporter substrate-binding protein [Paenibacillus sabuli]MBD2845308.1 ABC transporter substrate-binding protein [Paenibacillus sabuli]
MTVLLALAITACGGNGEDAQAQDAQPEEVVTDAQHQEASNDSAANGDNGVRTIEHLKGTSEIPASIERIVVLSAAYIDHLLTIGEVPVGVNVEARYGGDYLPYLADQLEGVVTLGSAESPNLEAIVELDPDVILVESRTAENVYEQLEKIAPTIVLGTEWLEYEEDPAFWTRDLMTIASMYGKEELAQAKADELQAKVKTASDTINGLDHKKLAYVRVREKLLQLYARKGHPTNTLLYDELGFEPSSLTPEEQRIDMSLEKVPELDADYIVLEVDPNGQEFLEGMNESFLWREVPAVKDEQTFETDSFWLFKGWGVIGRGEIVDDVLTMIQ